MTAKVRKHNLPVKVQAELEEAAREFFDSRIDEYENKMHYTFVRRWLLATCLALNDQLDLTEEQLQNVIEGIEEIMSGVVDEVYRLREIDENDKMSRSMIDELLDRGIHVYIHGDPMFGENEKEPGNGNR